MYVVVHRRRSTRDMFTLKTGLFRPNDLKRLGKTVFLNRGEAEKELRSNDRRPVAVVHHRNEIRQRPDLALSEYDDRGQLNTVIICPGCHWEEHHKRKLPVTEERW